MTDGPFKNAALSARWKKCGEALANDAMSRDERVEYVHNAIMRDLCTKETRALVRELEQYVQRVQKDLFPRNAVDAIFNEHPPTPQSDILQRCVNANLARPMPVEQAFQLAFDSFVIHEAASSRNRMIEESHSSLARGDMKIADLPKILDRNNETFNEVDYGKIRDDVLSGKRPSRVAIAKKIGVNEGPE